MRGFRATSAQPEHTRIEDSGGVELGLDGAQHPQAHGADLSRQPGGMVLPTPW